MIPVSNEYKRQLIAGNRNYVIRVEMTLADSTTLTLTNENIWESGIVIDEAISNDDTFDIGAAIVGSLKIVIDNIKETYSQYDFYDASVILYVGVSGDVDENNVQRYYRKGFYVVDEPTYNGSLITLNCLDYMTWFDVPFENIGVAFPTTAGQLVAAICSHVGVTLGTVAFPNYTTTISVEPEQKLNCREVLQYVAQICCCYCKISTAGQLILAWYNKNAILNITDYDGGSYNTNTTPYSDGCNLDGGDFTDWTSGDSADGGSFIQLRDNAYLSKNFEMNVSTDDIVVTGIRVRNTTKKEDSYDELWIDATLEQTHPRYVLVIENNPFVNQDNAATIANTVGGIVAGLPIRGFSATSLSDFSYETGDMVTIFDFRGNSYYTWITHFTFTTNNSEAFSCGVESLRKRSEERFSGTVKTLAEANENANAMLTDYDRAQAAMNELAQNALDYKVYEVDAAGGGHITWLYSGTTYDDTDPEHPLFPDSTIVIEISADGLFISHDGGLSYDAGLDANSGTAILNMIYAHGINCDWIHAGTLTLGGTDDVNGVCSVLNAQGVEKVRLDRTGVTVNSGIISGTEIRSWAGTTQSNGDSVTINGGSLRVYNSSSNFLQLTDVGHPDCNLSLGGQYFAAYDTNVYYGNYASIYIGKAARDAGAGSDRRLKKNINTLDKSLSRNIVRNCRPVSFEYRKDSGMHNENGIRFGLIAQELREVLDANNVGDCELEYVRADDYHTIEYKELTAHLINCIQDLYSEIDDLKQEVALLKAGE